jgi:hypothetical protein
MPTALLVAAALIASSPAVADRVPARVHLVLDIELPPGVRGTVTSGAIAEAASIWARYGVEIVARRAAPCGWLSDNVTALEVRLAVHAQRRSTTPLGAIVFSPAGEPGDVISIFYEDVVRFSTRSGGLGSPEPEWPRALREQVIGRVLGRVIAHEIGHFLLRWPAHSATGLMRAVQSTAALARAPTSDFLLSAEAVARLERVLNAYKETGPADRPWK